MKKIITALCLSITILLGMTGCSGNEISETESTSATSAENETVSEFDSETSATSTDNETASNTDSESSDNAAIHIEEIDWNVAASVLDGERIVSFNYTNNSKYTILEIELKFCQKEGLTAEQFAVFDNIKNEWELTDDEIANIYIIGYNRKCADPGETVSDSPCYIEDSYIYVENIAQYEMMEPDIMTIYYIGNDGKGYTIYYDFKSHTYSESSLGGQNIQEWSDSEICKLLPKIEAPEVKIQYDEETIFKFTANGVSRESFEAYVEAVKAKGFTNILIDNNNDYFASADDGTSAEVRYEAVKEQMTVYVSA